MLAGNRNNTKHRVVWSFHPDPLNISNQKCKFPTGNEKENTINYLFQADPTTKYNTPPFPNSR